MNTSQKILSDITVHMKYAKYLPENQRRETWEELVTRNKEMHIRKYPELKEDIEQAYKMVYDKKVVPSMRSMQFAGRPIEISPVRIYNCSYLPIDHPAAFSETMHLLLSGAGVGFSVQKHHIEKLPEIQKPNPKRTRRFLVGDSIEGWADSIKVLIKSYTGRSNSTPIFDFSDIRPKGARLITSGGKAPGPQPLKNCIHNLTAILESKQNGDTLTSIEVYDMICHIADAVLAGGIRRAALIALFSADDQEMLSAKTGAWWETNPQRGRANNSVVLLRHRLTKDIFMNLWKRIEASGAGEPGFFFTNDKAYGINPCVTGDTVLDVSIEGVDSILKMRMKDVVAMYLDGANILIKSYNKDTGEVVFSQITDAMLTRRDAEILRITDTESGKSIRCTPEHLIYTRNRGWVEAQNLKSDDILVIE